MERSMIILNLKGSKVHPDLVVSPPRDRLESNQVRTKNLALPPLELALEDSTATSEENALEKSLLAIEPNPASHETDENSMYTEDFSSEEKSSENRTKSHVSDHKLDENATVDQNALDITVISNSNMATKSNTNGTVDNSEGYNNEYSDDDGYGYSDEENYQRREEDDRSYENGYSKSHGRKARESKSYRGNELDYHHDRDILKDSQKGNKNQSQFPSTSTNEELEEKIRQARAEQEAFRREEERRVRTEAEERRRKNVSRLNRLRQEQKTAEDRRLAVVAQERHLKNEIADIEERRAELEKLIMLEIERSRRLEEQRNPNSKAKNPSKRKPVLGSVEFKRNANRDRIIQMAERIKFTKLRNENTIKRIENETARRKKMEEELRRVRSDMIRAKISHNRTYRTNNTKRNRAK